MTTVDQAREAVYKRFRDNWTGTPLTDTTLENDKFDSESRAEWVRVTLRAGPPTSPPTLGATGARKFDRIGLIFLDIFTAVDAGMARPGALAAEGLSLFEATRFQDVNGADMHTLDGTIREIGPDGKFYHTQLEVPLQYTETK